MTEPAPGAGTPAHNLARLTAGQMPPTVHLDLHGLGLRSLPPALFEQAEHLESLDLSGNRLTHLPDALAGWPRLRVLFASGNPFDELPGVLGECPALAQIGMRGCGMRRVPASALPPALRWLTLTDNALTTLPAALGDRPALEKLMLAGNQLTHLPEGLAGLPRLALIRLAANRFSALPAWLGDMPQLAWLAWGANPCEPTPVAPQSAAAIARTELRWGGALGSGASGRVQAAQWQAAGAPVAQAVAVKHFKGDMTSDGLPAHEMAACLAAGQHPHLVSTLGPLDTPAGEPPALVMRQVPSQWRPLAAPPSRESCSRDVYPEGWSLPWPTAARLALGIGQAGAHLHRQGLLHGDLYAHNVLWDGDQGQAVLSDLGAASFLPRVAGTPGPSRRALEGLDVRAWGLLLGELLQATTAPAAASPDSAAAVPATAWALARACTQGHPSDRPSLAAACAQLQALVPDART